LEQQGERPQRPLWLFDPPRQVHAEELEILYGPERIQGSWWQTGKPQQHTSQHDESVAVMSRDYFVARHRLGAECWAFVDAHDRWYLHGYFS